MGPRRSRGLAVGSGAILVGIWLLAGDAPRAPTPASTAGEAPPRTSGSPASAPSSAVTATRTPREEVRSAALARIAELRASGALAAPIEAARGSGEGAPAHVRPGGRPERRERLSRTRLDLLERTAVLRRSGEPVEIAGVRHTPYSIWKAGLPVLNRRGRIHERDGAPLGATGGTSLPPIEEGARRLGREAAVAIARAATGATALRAAPRAEPGWFARPGGTAPAWRVTLPAAEPLASFEVVLDARSGEILGSVDRLLRAEGTGFVYAKNPVEQKAPALAPLRALDGSGLLAGEITRILDENNVEAFAPDLEFSFPPGDPRFVQTAIYRGLTETGLFAASHGFAPFAAPLLAFANFPDFRTGGEYNNAFYDPALRLFGFGNGDGDVLRNLGIDLDVAAHEMGHHVFETLVEPLVFSDEDPVLAMHEGVADTFALLVGGDAEIGESTVPGRRYLRTLRSGARYPEGFHPDPHVTGLIYGRANYDLSRSLRASFADLLIASLPFVPPDPFPTDYRDAILAGDAALTGGRFARTIAKVFRSRGFDEMEFPPEFQGPLDDGIPAPGFLADREFHLYVFSEFPGSRQIRAELVGTGDADLLVASEAFDPNDPDTFRVSQGSTSFESVVLGPSSRPSVDDGDFWWVAVFDYPNGGSSSYTLTVTAELPAPGIAIGGTPVEGAIFEIGEIDFFVFSASADQVVRVETTALDPTLDPLVVVLDPGEFEILAFDDDSGPERDALIEGVRLPRTDRFALAVLSFVQDVDPRIGTGRYRLALSGCDNRGPDGDGDGLVDACDGDEDGDEFNDPDDPAPSDPARCADLDADACDDCSSGSWNFLEDGPDADRDGSCDGADADDDNDGCADALDPAPFHTSVDPDLDFLGDDCDVCPDVPDPLQSDVDSDGLGDACASCARLAWIDPAQDPPDQNPVASILDVSSPALPGRAKVRARGRFDPAGSAAPDPMSTGLHVRLLDRGGLVGEWSVPPDVPGCDARDRWTARSGRASVTWTYSNRSGALPSAGCAPGSAAGLTRAVLTATATSVSYDVQVSRATLARTLAHPLRFLQLDLVLGTQPGGGIGSPEGEAGRCAESVLWLSRPSSSCKVSAKSGVISKASCRSRP